LPEGYLAGLRSVDTLTAFFASIAQFGFKSIYGRWSYIKKYLADFQSMEEKNFPCGLIHILVLLQIIEEM
jgi:hypothetical protein